MTVLRLLLLLASVGYTHSELLVRFEPFQESVIFVGRRASIKLVCRDLEEDICVSLSTEKEGVVELLQHSTCLTWTAETNFTYGSREHLTSPDSQAREYDVISGHEIRRPASWRPPGVRDPVMFFQLVGLQPGRVKLHLDLKRDNRSTVQADWQTYFVSVVTRVNVIEDAFLYVLSVTEMLTLLMLGFRLRKAAVKEVVLRPCGLLAGLLCQVMLMPLVTLGASLVLSLDVHHTVCMLIVGCCPTGVLSPMFAVLQHAHVELSVLLLLLETFVAFGAMPLWLFTYGHFLGVAYHEVSFPFSHIAGTLGGITWPVLAGAAIQRCVPRALGPLDKAIHPTCLLLTLTAFTVSAYNLWQSWGLASWRLLAATSMVPVIGGLVGALATLIFRQKMPEVKAVALVTGLQNTLLATIILQTSYPAHDASLMHTALVCLEFTTLTFMYVAYAVHLLVWVLLPHYRTLHDNVGISGIYRSIAEKIVKSMVKAGEITFKNKGNRGNGDDKTVALSDDSSPVSSGITQAAREAASQGFSTLGIRNKIFAATFDTMRGSSRSVCNVSNETSDNGRSRPATDFAYFGPQHFKTYDHSAPYADPGGALAYDIADVIEEDPDDDRDSLSGIDYEMLTAQDLPDSFDIGRCPDGESQGAGSDPEAKLRSLAEATAKVVAWHDGNFGESLKKMGELPV